MVNLVEAGRAAGAQYLTSLRYRDYRYLWSANVFAGAAHWALIVSRGWLVFDLSDSSALVGVVTFAAMIPRFLVSPFAGLLADRMDRRTLLAWVFGVNLVHNLVLASLTMLGAIHVWPLVALSLVNGSARATQMPASGSLLPNLVPREHLPNAIALNQATVHGSRLVGPMLIAPLLAMVGPAGAFSLCTVFYGLGLIQVLLIRTASTGVVRSDEGVLENMLVGLYYVYHHSLLLPLILLVVGHCALTMSYESILPVLSSDKLGADGVGFSYIMMAVGAGALLGLIALAGMKSERARGRALLLSGILSGFATVALAASPNLPLALLAAAGIGASQASFMAFFATIVQSIVPDAIRGRVTGINNLHIGGLMAIFNLVNGSLADLFGAPILLVVPGLAFVALISMSLLNPTLRGLYTSGISSPTAVP
jgi:MFS family permease